MDELRPEIRSAFEKEQAAHQPGPALRRDLVNAVAAHPRPAPNLQWLAVAAAILIGFAVVIGLMSSRLAGQRTPVPGNSPKASPVADYGPPPSGIPLLYVNDPNNPLWLIGYDWSGHPRGTVKLDPTVPPGIRMAPDGSTFEFGGYYKGGGEFFLDRLGKPIPAPQATNVAGSRWADDNKHLCLITLNQQTLVWGLSTLLPGQPAQPVGVIARDRGVGQSGINLAACSFKNNLAIAVRTTVSWPAELWSIRLSDGRVLSHRAYNAGALTTVVASRDGVYVAENQAPVQAPAVPQPTIIRRVADGKAVADLGLSAQVIAFSADDTQVLLTNVLLYDNTSPASLAIKNWGSGQIIWTYSGPSAFGGYVAQPDANGFAVAFMAPTRLGPDPCGGADQPPCGQVDDSLRDVLIVHGNGSTTAIPGRYQPTW